MFHQIERAHLLSRWDVGCVVFWKGSILCNFGATYLHLILIDEEVCTWIYYFYYVRDMISL